MNSAPRLAKIREKLVAEHVEALLVECSHNIDYVTGIDGIHDEENPHVALISASKAVLFTDTRYVEVAEKGSAGSEWEICCPQEKQVDAIAAFIKDEGFKTLAIEDTMGYGKYTKWSTQFDGTTVTPAESWVERVRYIKDPEEIERIAQAQSITDAAFDRICKFITVGRTEKEIARALENAMFELGASGLAFDSIVASGANGSLPHAVPSDKKVEQGDFLTLDFGAEVNGYKSDMTRTVILGEPSEEQLTVYHTVRAAQEAAVAAVKAGVTGVEVDKAARDVIMAAGYGDYFGHGTGHGVGLAIHEGPNASPRSEDTLQAGELLTIEPGIYLPGRFGVRIEDLLVVENDSARNLTTSTKELIQLW